MILRFQVQKILELTFIDSVWSVERIGQQARWLGNITLMLKARKPLRRRPLNLLYILMRDGT